MKVAWQKHAIKLLSLFMVGGVYIICKHVDTGSKDPLLFGLSDPCPPVFFRPTPLFWMILYIQLFINFCSRNGENCNFLHTSMGVLVPSDCARLKRSLSPHGHEWNLFGSCVCKVTLNMGGTHSAQTNWATRSWLRPTLMILHII